MKILQKFTNLQQRIIAGIIGLAIMITGICWNEWSFFVTFLVISLVCLYEFYTLLEKSNIQSDKWFGLILGGSLYVFSFLIHAGWINFEALWVIYIFSVTLFIIELYSKKDNPFQYIAFTLLGIFYVILPFTLLQWVVFDNNEYDYRIVLMILLILWANDIGAYFTGMYLGKTRLFERISPKKTWEGFIGGAIFALLITGIMLTIFTSLHTLTWWLIAVIIIITATYGDLVESMFKRSLSIKDSGNIIPGHGGFLDRFDGLLLVLPFVAFFLKFF
ncbi:MAG: phosphatidate cytidylyltransferase [Microscillaceae bacterium]|nr:phosphatidate cytidylyltransferase [Microscillaceae bacterium]MDW8460467.1 phosphatidate cytidylyltransferase [Cytophagales bacterium]